MKKVVFVLVLIASMMLGALVAQADEKLGWMIVFTLSDNIAEVGACDYAGYCSYVPGGRDGAGIHLGIGSLGSVERIVHTAFELPVAETVVAWNNSDTDLVGVLSWRWMNYDSLQNRFIAGQKPANVEARLWLIIQNGHGITVKKIDPNGGAVRVTVRSHNTADVADARVAVSVIPAPVVASSTLPATKVVSKGK